MGATFRIESKGGAEIEARLGDLAAAFGDLKPLMDQFGVYLESATIERFDAERAPDGAAWPQSIRAREDGGKTLTDSGQLRSSVTSQAGADSVAVGTNKIYAGVHQFGATIAAKNARALAFFLPGGLGLVRVPEVTIPARPFLGLSGEDEAELLALAGDYARDALGGAA